MPNAVPMSAGSGWRSVRGRRRVRRAIRLGVAVAGMDVSRRWTRGEPVAGWSRQLDTLCLGTVRAVFTSAHGLRILQFKDPWAPLAAEAHVRVQLVNQVTNPTANAAQPAVGPATYAGRMRPAPIGFQPAPQAASPPPDEPGAPAVPRRLANFHTPCPPQPALRDWLVPSRNALFRWTMSMATSGEGRRAIAEMAVSIQRLRGADAFGLWLYEAALQAAMHQGSGFPEESLVGLPPELRALLRLVARGDLRREEAMALLAQGMDFVRGRLVHTRLAGNSAPAPLDSPSR